MIGEPTDPEQRRVADLTIVVLAVALHLVGLYWPTTPDVGPLGFPGLDKVIHLLLFAAPTWALLRLWPRYTSLILGVMLLHIPISEFVQASLLPARSGDWWDAVADLVGVLVGWWTYVSPSNDENVGNRLPGAGERK